MPLRMDLGQLRHQLRVVEEQLQKLRLEMDRLEKVIAVDDLHSQLAAALPRSPTPPFPRATPTASPTVVADRPTSYAAAAAATGPSDWPKLTATSSSSGLTKSKVQGAPKSAPTPPQAAVVSALKTTPNPQKVLRHQGPHLIGSGPRSIWKIDAPWPEDTNSYRPTIARIRTDKVKQRGLASPRSDRPPSRAPRYPRPDRAKDALHDGPSGAADEWLPAPHRKH